MANRLRNATSAAFAAPHLGALPVSDRVEILLSRDSLFFTLSRLNATRALAPTVESRRAGPLPQLFVFVCVQMSLVQRMAWLDK